MSEYHCERCKTDLQPKNFGNARSCAFNSDGSFNPKNWNCATISELLDNPNIKEIFGMDETCEVLLQKNYGGFLVFSRYKRRGRTSSAYLIGDFYPAKELTLEIAIDWINKRKEEK